MTYAAVGDAVFGLMAEAAVEAAVRLGVRDPWPAVRDLERLGAPFEAPVVTLGELRCTDSEPRVRWALGGSAVDEAGIEGGARAERDAALMTGALWAAVRAAGGPRSLAGDGRVVPSLLDPEFLLRLGTGADEPSAGLQVHHGWALLLCRWLGALSGSPLSVLCVQETQDGEQGGGGQACRDAWYGVVVQLSGATVWSFGDEGLGEVTEVTTRPGDVLLVPDGLPYRPVVGPDAGPSRRLVFTLRRRELSGC